MGFTFRIEITLVLSRKELDLHTFAFTLLQLALILTPVKLGNQPSCFGTKLHPVFSTHQCVPELKDEKAFQSFLLHDKCSSLVVDCLHNSANLTSVADIRKYNRSDVIGG